MAATLRTNIDMTGFGTENLEFMLKGESARSRGNPLALETLTR
jgi:hypothetical protein